MKNLMKDKLSEDQSVIGCFISFYCPPLVEIIGYSGYDFIIIDDEHGAFSYSEISEMVRVAKMVNITPIVRVSYDKSAIQKVFDQGAHGVQVPMVNNAKEAEAIVKKTKYPPIGNRGVSYSIPSANYGFKKGRELLEETNSNSFIAIQIETQRAVENFDEILDVPGIDIVFIGTTDLSVDMGYDSPNHHEMKKLVEMLFQKGKKKGMKIGIVASDNDTVMTTLSLGADYIAVVTNSVIKDSLKNIIDNIEMKKQ